ncbi:hypothetical protein ACH5RR_037015 [Cinchona calisaya]|uniref:Uncharacterized protein n=1 Tax=Cinchona calisaya TaxID=153742 RepID=A0ABD2Y4W7_9GENT
MEFCGEIIRFNIYKAMRYPSDVHSTFAIDVINSIVQKVFELNSKDRVEAAITKHLIMDNLKDPKGKLALKEHPPILEIKPLPNHLKYIFLGDKNNLLVIIEKDITPLQEKKLV